MLSEKSEIAPVLEAELDSQIVYVVDDDEDLLSSLEFLLLSQGYTVKTFLSAEQFLNQVSHQSMGCAIIDVRMPDIGGMELLGILKKKRATFPIIMLTGHAELPVAVQAIKRGAFNFHNKADSQEELLETVRDALKHCYENRDSQCKLRETGESLNSLTEREAEILEHVLEGKTSEAISREIDVKKCTVEAHRRSLLAKLKVANVAQLVSRVLLYRQSLPPEQR